MLTSPLLAYRVGADMSLSPTNAPTRGSAILTGSGPVVVASHCGYPGFRPSGQPLLVGIGGCCRPRIDTQLAVDVGDVALRRGRATAEPHAHPLHAARPTPQRHARA